MASPRGGTKAKPQTRAKRVRSAAPGQLLGFGLQETLLTHRLLTAPAEASLSLELLDDVAIHVPGGQQALVQTKSALTDNPVADRAISLWKTLHNWVTLVSEQGVNPANTQFVLYVSKVVTGNLVQLFSATKDGNDVDAALSAARSELWGEAPAYIKRQALPEELAKHVAAVLSAAHSLLVPMLVNFKFECGSGSPHDDLIKQLEQQLSIEEASLETVAQQALGWVKRKLESRLEKQLPAIVSRNDFYADMRAFLRRIDQQRILLSLAPSPTEEEAKQQRPSTYVRQLELIEFDDNRILSAISDFLKAAADRVDWSRRGLVHEQSFDDLDASLRATWSNLSLISEAQHAADQPVRLGRALYGSCMTHQTPVQGMTAPDHFVRGCFQRLADGKHIGWHPEFGELLKQEKGKSG
jgi:hypothetical protein